VPGIADSTRREAETKYNLSRSRRIGKKED